MKKLVNKLSNEKLLEVITEVYNYDVIYNNDGSIIISDDESTDTYSNIELALIDWLPTLIESEQQYILEDADITWMPEINQIKEIKNNLKYNELSTSIKDNLVYGEVPEEMYKNISVFLDEQIKKVNDFIKIKNENNLDIEIIKASLPTEFILENNELKYIKIANLDFIKRLLNGDTSEIEDYEMDKYDINGKIIDIAFVSLMNTKKFEINIPVVLTLKNKYLRLQTPVNSLYLI